MSVLLPMGAMLAGACLLRAGLGAVAWAGCLATSVVWSLLDPEGAREAIREAELGLRAG